MKLQALSFLFLAAATASLTAACSADTSDPAADDGDADDVTVDEANAAKVTPGSFKLYSQPNATPNASCDVHTKLTFAAATYSTAKIEEGLDGFCELYVEPNPRKHLRLQCALRIRDFDLHQSGAGGGIEHGSDTGDLAGELVHAERIHRDSCGVADAQP